MSHSLVVRGIRQPDKRWKEMKAVYDACIEADVHPPDEVWRFFDDRAPDPAGISIGLDESSPGVEIHEGEMQVGYLICLGSLPGNITHLRVYIAY